MNQLTPEQLDMIKRLQPKFKEAMGEWPLKGDEYLIDDTLYYFGGELPKFKNNNTILRIPKLYDWQNPERGLWEMIDWTYHDISRVSDGGFVYLTQARTCNGYLDPFTALLKALCEQEGNK